MAVSRLVRGSSHTNKPNGDEVATDDVEQHIDQQEVSTR
jgi:hypothetical protein